MSTRSSHRHRRGHRLRSQSPHQAQFLRELKKEVGEAPEVAERTGVGAGQSSLADTEAQKQRSWPELSEQQLEKL